MVKDTLTLRSTVSPDLKKWILYRGSALAIIGFLPLLYAGTMMPADRLAFWGFPLFLLSFTLMAAGLKPYRKICKLEGDPNEIILTPYSLLYKEHQTPLFTIPFSQIKEIKQIKKNNHYGIGVKLKQSASSVTLHQPIELNKLKKRMQNTYAVDLYFPYFSYKSYRELVSICVVA